MQLMDAGARACQAYEAALEDYLETLEENPSASPEPGLAKHLGSCAACQRALEEIRDVCSLVRESAVRVPESLAGDPYFAVRAGARARESVRRGAEFWPQLQTFSLRFMAVAFSAALMLGAMAMWGSQRSAAQASIRLRPADPRVLSPELNPAPGNANEVVVALWSSSAQRSGGQR